MGRIQVRVAWACAARTLRVGAGLNQLWPQLKAGAARWHTLPRTTRRKCFPRGALGGRPESVACACSECPAACTKAWRSLARVCFRIPPMKTLVFAIYSMPSHCCRLHSHILGCLLKRLKVHFLACLGVCLNNRLLLLARHCGVLRSSEGATRCTGSNLA